MKKIITILICVLCIASVFVGCGQVTTVNSKDLSHDSSGYYTVVSTGYSYSVVYDNETKVMYHISGGYYNTGTATMLVNPDGTPKIYRGN